MPRSWVIVVSGIVEARDVKAGAVSRPVSSEKLALACLCLGGWFGVCVSGEFVGTVGCVRALGFLDLSGAFLARVVFLAAADGDGDGPALRGW